MLALGSEALACRVLVKNLLKNVSSLGACFSSNPEGKLKEFHEIPGPRALPIVGTLWRYYLGDYSLERIHHTYAKLFAKYGYLVREEVFWKRTLLHVFHPDDMARVYDMTKAQSQRLSHTSLLKYRRDRPHLYDSAGLGPSNGEEWRQLVQTFNQCRHPDFVDVRLMEVVVTDLIQLIKESLDHNKEMDLKPLLLRCSLEIVGMLTMNIRLGALEKTENPRLQKLIKAAEDTHHAIFRHENNILKSKKEYKKLVEAQDYTFEVVSEFMKQCLSDPKCKDSFLWKNWNREGISQKDVRTVLLDFFQGGIHSVSFTTCFALYHLARNKAVQDRLRAELHKALPTREVKFVPCKYLNGIIDETFRFNPPSIGTGRVNTEEFSLRGYRIPKGTIMILNHQVASRDPAFHERCSEFLPQRRFTRPISEGLEVMKVTPQVLGASKPYGSGGRTCFGHHVANDEMRVIIAAIVRNFEVSYHHEDIDTINILHNEPDRPVRIRLQEIPH